VYHLFNEFAHRYDLHTPPGHYRHDHAFVIAEALRVEPTHCRLLDIGCGTGVFLEAACAAGIDGHGLDASQRMIDHAKARLPGERLRVERMQEITDQDAYDVVCALSWTIHYCETEAELDDVVARCRTALRTGGLLVLQVADDRQMTGAVTVDRELGPSLKHPLIFHKMANILLYILCSANIVANSSSNGRNRCVGQLGICS